MRISDIVAAESTFEVGGKAYRRVPLTAKEYAKIETRILSMRGDPIKVAHRLAEVLNSDERKALFERAYEDAVKAKIVTADEINAYANTLAGAVYFIYLSLQKYHPDIDEDKVAELVEQHGSELLDGLVAELQEQVPDATPEQVARLVVEKEAGVTAELVTKVAGLPEGNSASPTQEETESTDLSHGNDGLES